MPSQPVAGSSGFRGHGAPPPGFKVPASSSAPSSCLIGMPKIGIGPVSAGGGCMLSKTEARAVMGTLIMTAGGLVMFIGVLWLAAWGAKRSGIAEKAAGALEILPGGGVVASSVRAIPAQQRQKAAAKAAAGGRAPSTNVMSP